MHPQLSEHNQEQCIEAMRALDKCHNANSFNKFLGLCNDVKIALDNCLKEEFVVKRAENKAKAAEKRARMEKIWKDIEEPPADFGKQQQ
ncbi:hypothetical protein DFQ28_010957 [Apophysomyces sp. BC1034]